MSSNNDSGERDEDPTQDATQDASPEAGPQPAPFLDTLLEALTTVTGTLQALAGPEMRDHVTDVQTQVHALFETALRREHGAGAASSAAAQVKRLIETVTKTGTGPTIGAGSVAPQGKAGLDFLGVDLSPLTDGLRVLDAWLKHPIGGGQAEVEQLIAKLQATMAPTAPGVDPRAADHPPDEVDRPVKSPFDHLFHSEPDKD